MSVEQEFDHALDRVDADQHTPWGKLRYEQVSHNLTPHLPNRTLHVLDAAGGNGTEAVQLAEKGHHVTVLDLSTRSMQDAGERAEAAGEPHRSMRKFSLALEARSRELGIEKRNDLRVYSKPHGERKEVGHGRGFAFMRLTEHGRDPTYM